MSTVSRNIFNSVWIPMVLWGLIPDHGWASSRSIEPFRYDSARALAKVWKPGDDTPPPRLQKSKEVMFTCPFKHKLDRYFWDRNVQWDLSRYTRFSLTLSCPQPEAIRAFMVYMKSGNGWYTFSKPMIKPGRQTLSFSKGEAKTEGSPDGWHRIEQIRLSPWRGAAANTYFIAHAFEAHQDTVMVVQGTASTSTPEEAFYSKKSARFISRLLTNMGISHGLITDETVMEGGLGTAGVAILSYHPRLPEKQRNMLQQFVDRGGRLLVFDSADSRLAALMGIILTTPGDPPLPGAAKEVHFKDPQGWKVPASFQQSMTSSIRATPWKPGTSTIATWRQRENQGGEDLPAVLATPYGVWFASRWTEEDSTEKQYVLLGLLAHYSAELWRTAANHAVTESGQLTRFNSFADACAAIEQGSLSSPNRKQVDQLLTQTRSLHGSMLKAYEAKRYRSVIQIGKALKHGLIKAYSYIQEPVEHELRGMWDHDAVGWYPGDWDRSASLLARHGFNAIFPNMQWAGLAHYSSRVLPTSKTFSKYGDQLKQCVMAAKKYRLQVHVWKICWKLGPSTPSTYYQDLKQEGRLQVDGDGKVIPWLCPSHPKNITLELRAIKEMVRRYDIQGIHLDCIRYPSAQTCYSPVTRAAFEKSIERVIPQWPHDVKPEGRYRARFLRWRSEQLTQFVATVNREIKKIKPRVKLSAAVFNNYPRCIDGLGQDWGSWLRRGYLDFACPMNYTQDSNRFKWLTEQQLLIRGTGNRIIPGIGVTSSESWLGPNDVMDQISLARELGSPGFVLFDLNPVILEEVMPYLSLGITRPTSR